VWNRRRREEVLIDVNDVALGHETQTTWDERDRHTRRPAVTNEPDPRGRRPRDDPSPTRMPPTDRASTQRSVFSSRTSPTGEGWWWSAAQIVSAWAKVRVGGATSTKRPRCCSTARWSVQ
jgi:hypothetical protein